MTKDSLTVASEIKRRPDWQWYFLLLLLVAVLVIGLLVALSQDAPFPLLFAVAAFSIAFAIHYFAVSIGLNGVFIQESDLSKRAKLCEIEYDIVSSGMLVLSGGLFILLAGGIGMLLRDSRWVFLTTYIIGALLLILGVARYALCQRGWPRKAQEVVDNQS